MYGLSRSIEDFAKIEEEDEVDIDNEFEEEDEFSDDNNFGGTTLTILKDRLSDPL